MRQAGVYYSSKIQDPQHKPYMYDPLSQLYEVAQKIHYEQKYKHKYTQKLAERIN